MTVLDAFASLPHYAAHLRPIFDALPPDRQGTFWGPFGTPLPGRHAAAGSGPVLAAGYNDARRMAPRRVVLVEHGAGQAYPGDPRSAAHPSYSGGAEWDTALGFVCPSEAVADRWRARYPSKVAHVVGCPALDRWHSSSPLVTLRPTVAFAFHWDCPLVPETRSAWSHYDHHLAQIAERLRRSGCAVVGHAHPRWRGVLERRFSQAGMAYAETLDDVIAGGAAVLVADNTSAMYEFAAVTDRPVVVLNAPWYRRGVEHGLRFWSHVPGVQVERPQDLPEAIASELTEDRGRDLRRAAVRAAYGVVDGQASTRAAAAVLSLVDGAR